MDSYYEIYVKGEVNSFQAVGNKGLYQMLEKSQWEWVCYDEDSNK